MSSHPGNANESAPAPQTVVPAVAKLRDLCATCDRNSVTRLCQYDDCCLETCSSAASAVLGIEFNQDQLAPRRSKATKAPLIDLRSKALWSFIDIFTSAKGSGGMLGVAHKTGVKYTTLRKYWGNCNSKSRCLTREAVVSCELQIIDYLGSQMTPVALPAIPNPHKASSVSAPIRVQPLHIIQTPDAGDLAVMALGEHHRNWVFKA